MIVLTVPLRTVSGMNARRVRELLEYDQISGLLTRRIKNGQNVKVGAIAGHVDKQGYRRVRLDGKTYAAHRVAWVHAYGVFPANKIDHINGVRDDNRLGNLREVDHSTNLENQRQARKDNRLGVLGVRPSGARFEARIWVKGKPQTIGSYATVGEAGAAYVEAKRRLHAGCTL